MRTLTRRSLAAATLAALAIVAAACFPEPPPPTTTTTTSEVPGTVVSVDDAVLEWAISNETNNAAFNGQHNYWSAGQSDSTEATYVATNGNATVLKKNSSGDYVPIGSESAVSWTNRGKDGNGVNVTVFSANFLGQKVRYSDGTGTVDTTSGEATISWDGTFTINFYGSLVPFWITDPVLDVDASGNGTLSATVGGYASDISNPDERTPLDDVEDVVIAELPDVWATGSLSTGFSAAPTDYLGNAVTVEAPNTPQAAMAPCPCPPGNESYWGGWPQDFVDFQSQTGLGSYWYTSGLASTDAQKPQQPVSVSFTLD